MCSNMISVETKPKTFFLSCLSLILFPILIMVLFGFSFFLKIYFNLEDFLIFSNFLVVFDLKCYFISFILLLLVLVYDSYHFTAAGFILSIYFFLLFFWRIVVVFFCDCCSWLFYSLNWFSFTLSISCCSLCSSRFMQHIVLYLEWKVWYK